MVKPTGETSRIASVKRSIASHPVGAFLIILYPVSWVFFLPDLLGKSGFGIIPVDIPAQVGILLVTIFGLTSVAFLVTRIADGKAGTRALRRHYYRFRAGPQWYLLAIFGPPMLLLVAGLALHGGSALSPIGHNAAQIPTAYLLNVALIAVLISVWEEGGWMAFMTSRLQPRLGRVLASVVVAPLFGFIHFPLFLVTGGLIDSARPQGGPYLRVRLLPAGFVFRTRPHRDHLGLQFDARQLAGGGAAACLDRHDRIGRGVDGVLSGR